jgi:hypothetical protein
MKKAKEPTPIRIANWIEKHDLDGFPMWISDLVHALRKKQMPDEVSKE